VFQQFNWLQKIVHESGGKNGHSFQAPSEALKNRNQTNNIVVVHSPSSIPGFRGTKDSNRDSGNIEGAAVLVFQFPNHSGQGTGNIMSGALAAQLLAEEFNRTLCHAGAKTTNFRSSFQRAFEWRDHRHKEVCDRILLSVEEAAQRDNVRIYDVVPNASNTIVQRNYDKTSEQSECAMRDLLLNYEDYPIVYYEGNTYPRWPNKAVSLPKDYFHERFNPTQFLRDVLPWKELDPPTTVVHLREGDSIGDYRGGLDDQTLSLLTKEDFLDVSNSKQTVFLVTNNVEWYPRFPKWSHPKWSLVHHSALKRISWGGTPGSNHGENKGDGELQMWADWYTLLSAQNIYHTFSDFSRSTARWNENIKSWTILGSTNETTTTEEGKAGPRLLLRNDIEILPNESQGVSRLVDRTSRELWFCGNPSPEETKHVQEKKDRQLLDLVRARKRRGFSFYHASPIEGK
jgi:hypothetical protein